MEAIKVVLTVLLVVMALGALATGEDFAMFKFWAPKYENVATFTYIPDIQGNLHHLCDSIGYGLPYGVQYTNPERINQNSTTALIPQPEPNGLFMPSTAEGTWVICAGKNGDFEPIYSEPRVIVSPFKLQSVGEYRN